MLHHHVGRIPECHEHVTCGPDDGITRMCEWECPRVAACIPVGLLTMCSVPMHTEFLLKSLTSHINVTMFRRGFGSASEIV